MVIGLLGNLRTKLWLGTEHACSRTSNCDGTKLQHVTRCSLHSRARYCVSFSPPGAASSSRPPHAKELKSSCTDASKLMGAFCRTTSLGPSFSFLRVKKPLSSITLTLRSDIPPAAKYNEFLRGEALQVVGDAGVLQDSALGAPGAARREDDVAHVIRLGALAGRRAWLLSNFLPLAVHLQD